MGKVTKSSLNAFQEWHNKNETHLNRHLSIITRQADIFSDYVRVVKSYPVNTQEFVEEIMRLHNSIRSLSDEMKEVTSLFAEDCDNFIELLNVLKSEMLSHSNE